MKSNCKISNKLNFNATLTDGQNITHAYPNFHFKELQPNKEYEIKLIGTEQRLSQYPEGWRYVVFQKFFSYHFKTLPDFDGIYFISREMQKLIVYHYIEVLYIKVNDKDGSNLEERSNSEEGIKVFDVTSCQDYIIEITTKNGSVYNISSERLTSCACPEIQKNQISYETDANTSEIKLYWNQIFTKDQTTNILCGVDKYYVFSGGKLVTILSETVLKISLCNVFETDDVIIEGRSYENLTLSNGSVSVPSLSQEKLRKIFVNYEQTDKWLEVYFAGSANENYTKCEFMFDIKNSLKIKSRQSNSNQEMKRLKPCSTYNITIDIKSYQQVYQTRHMIIETPVRGI